MSKLMVWYPLAGREVVSIAPLVTAAVWQEEGPDTNQKDYRYEYEYMNMNQNLNLKTKKEKSKRV